MNFKLKGSNRVISDDRPSQVDQLSQQLTRQCSVSQPPTPVDPTSQPTPTPPPPPPAATPPVTVQPSAVPPRLPYPIRDQDPVSEFSTGYLGTLAFPCLFLNGRGDPWQLTAESVPEKRLGNMRHLLKYCEKTQDGKLECRFAENPRFVLWVYNIHYRHLALNQGKIYLQQNPGDANLTLDEIRDLLNANNRTNPVLNRIRHYMSGIPGTPSYWHNNSCNLKAIIESKGLPHVFFTFTFADRFVFVYLFVIY